MQYRNSTYSIGTVDSYLFVTNLQGDIEYIYDAYGNRVVTYVYDAWGNILSVTGSKATTVGAMNPFRYRGYYYDIETGFYYLNSRYYNPEIGRFISSDKCNHMIQKYNLYEYLGNCPIGMPLTTARNASLNNGSSTNSAVNKSTIVYSYQSDYMTIPNQGQDGIAISADDLATIKYILLRDVTDDVMIGYFYGKIET